MTSWIQNLCCYHQPGFITCEIKVCCVGLIHTLHVSFKTINQEIFLVNANHKNRRIWYLINYSIPLLLFFFIFRFLTFTRLAGESINGSENNHALLHQHFSIIFVQIKSHISNPKGDFFLFFIRGFFVEKLGRRDIWNIKEKKGENIYNACFHHSRGPKTKTVHEEGANGTHAWFCLASISPFRFLGRRHTEPINLLKQAKLIDMLQHVGSFDSKFVYTISY